MEKKKIRLDDLGDDFEIQEPDKKTDLEIIYCGKVEADGNRGVPPLSYKSLSFAISFFIITITMLLISGAVWGYGNQDWGPFQVIGDFICKLIKSVRIR